MKADPLFSVITVTRNNLTGLAATWQSLAAQTCTDFEWIVIDGASTDATLSFLKDKPALVVSEPDRGIYDAMNKGIERAGGTYLIFMNAGDRFAGPEVLASLAALLHTTPAFLYADALEGFYKTARPHSAIHQGMITHHQAMVYNRAALGELRYDLRWSVAADYDLTLRFLKDIQEEKIIYWPRALCIFEPGGLSQRRVWKGRAEQYKIRAGLGMSAPLNAFVFTAQTLLYTLRRACPPLYRFFKSRIRR